MTAPPHLRLVSTPPTASLQACSDDDLMRLVQAGQRDAFATLVERHAARIAHLCTRFVNSATLGVELAQDTWLKVWTDSSRYRPEGRFEVWLATLARNTCRNQLRAQAARRRREQQLESQPMAASEVDELLARERERRVHEALARLPPPLREALALRFADDLRYEQMEQVLGVSESTLRSRVHHGLKRLRRYLERDS
jgi:RNA polymerase sigma-70 factor (ECF subfamily)